MRKERRGLIDDRRRRQQAIVADVHLEVVRRALHPRLRDGDRPVVRFPDPRDEVAESTCDRPRDHTHIVGVADGAAPLIGRRIDDPGLQRGREQVGEIEIVDYLSRTGAGERRAEANLPALKFHGQRREHPERDNPTKAVPEQVRSFETVRVEEFGEEEE